MRFKSIGIFAVGIVVAFCASSVSAEPTSRHLELAQRYMVDIQLDQQMTGAMKALLPLMMADTQKYIKMSEAQKADLDAIFLESFQDYMAKAIARLPPLIAETFTEAELTDLVAFYESPTGRSVIAKAPQLQARTIPMVKELLPGLQVQVRTKICARFGCPAPSSTASPSSPPTQTPTP